VCGTMQQALSACVGIADSFGLLGGQLGRCREEHGRHAPSAGRWLTRRVRRRLGQLFATREVVGDDKRPVRRVSTMVTVINRLKACVR
jgi:hypothetical protein